MQHGAVPSYVPLDDESLQKIHHLFKDVKLFILDEISMVSNLMIVYIHRRLCEIFSEPCSVLGGRNVVVFWDLLQLSPVKNGPCFSDLGKQEKDILKGMSFLNLWKAVQYEELLENVRQSHDNRFSEILQDVRAGFIKEVDEEWLVEECRFKYAKHTKLEQKKEIAEFVYKKMVANRNYTILVPTTKMVTQLNQDVLKLIPGDSKSLSAIDSIVTRRSVASIQNNPYIKRAVKKLEDDPRQTAGLESILKLKIGAKLLLRRNLDVSRGLCNGAIRKLLKYCVHSSNRRKVEALLVEFVQCTTEIKRVKSDFFVFRYNKNVKVQREQFPLTLAYAMTVHKAQGLTLDYAMVDCGKEIFDRGQIYVALSRVKSSDNLQLLNFNVSRLSASASAIAEYTRLGSKIKLPQCNISDKSKKRKCTQVDVDYTSKVRKFDVLDQINQKYLPATIVGTFDNPSSVSCYANATIQCLLNFLPRSELASLNELGKISDGHQNAMVQSLLALRREVGHGFQMDEQQCPAEFIDRLFSTEPYARLRSLFEMIVEESYFCSNSTCSRQIDRNSWPASIHQVQATTTNSNVEELLKISQQDKITDTFCSDCQSAITSCVKILSSKRYFILKINPVTDLDRITKKKTLVKQITNKSITVGDSVYKFKCMVSHCGNITGAHYVAWLKNNRKWMMISDLNVKNDLPWPNNGYEEYGKKSPYLLFYAK